MALAVTVKTGDSIASIFTHHAETKELLSEGMFVNGNYYPRSHVMNWEEALKLEKEQNTKFWREDEF